MVKGRGSLSRSRAPCDGFAPPPAGNTPFSRRRHAPLPHHATSPPGLDGWHSSVDEGLRPGPQVRTALIRTAWRTRHLRWAPRPSPSSPVPRPLPSPPHTLRSTPNSMNLILWGGLAYTGGIPFFVRNTNYSHTLWHLFVMSGSACYWLALFRIVQPGSWLPAVASAAAAGIEAPNL